MAMLPSLLYIQSSKKKLVTLVWKKTITVGINNEADIIVNNSYLVQKKALLGQSFSTKEMPKNNKKTFFLPLTIHQFKIDGLHARLFLPNAKLILFHIIVFGLLAVGIATAINTYPSNHQDWVPIALPTQDVYGFCRQDKNHAKGINFTFIAEKVLPHRLYFLAGGRGDGTNITFILNGKAIDIPFHMPKGWGKETSINLPASKILIGENNLKLYVENRSNEQPSWGISNVRTSSISQPDDFTPDTIAFKPNQILKALQNVDLQPQQLAEFHMVITQWKSLDTFEKLNFNKEEILKIIENRMKNILLKIAFDVRSKSMLGDQTSVRQLLNDTAKWIPEHWVEGKRIYDAINR